MQIVVWLFVDTLSQLDRCGIEIDAACSFPLDEEAMSALEQCYNDATVYLTKVDNCLDPQFIVQQGCACFAAIQVGDLFDKVTACETKTANDLVKTEKKKCVKSKRKLLKYQSQHMFLSSHFTEFAACKSAQDDTISLVDTCKEKIKCGGASSKEEAEMQLKALTP